MAVICRVWVLVLTPWRYIVRRGSDSLQPNFFSLEVPRNKRILVPFYLLGPLGGVSTANSENGEGQKFCQGVKDHFVVAVVSYDGAITGPSGVRCGRRNALPLHSSILLHVVQDSIFSIFF